MDKHSGSCLCQENVFEITGSFDGFFLCHCSRCRKISGTAHASNLFSSTASINWLMGGADVKTYKYKETRFAKCFCGTCGSSLPYVGPTGRLVVPAGCLDTDVDTKANAHIFLGSKANWDENLDQVRKFDELPK